MEKIPSVINQEPSISNPVNLEFVAIVAAGMYLHLYQLSIIDLKQAKLPGIQPNIASTIFVFSVLCVLAKSRPYWPSCLRHPPRLFRFAVEVFLILYVTDRVVRQVWIPMLKFVNFMCTFLSEYLVVINTSVLATQMMGLARWTKHRAFYYVRFLISLSVFYFMAEVTGMTEYFREARNKFGVKTSELPTIGKSNTVVPPSLINISARRSIEGLEQQTEPVRAPKRKPIRIIPKKHRQYAPYPFD